MTTVLKMTSRERALAAFAHQEPDRVPINYLCNPGIDARLKKHFGLKPEDDEGLYRALQVDFRGVGIAYTGPNLHEEAEGLATNPEWGFRTRWVENESGGYWDYCNYPLEDADDEVIANWPVPSPDDYDYDGLVARAQKFHDEGFCVTFGDPGTVDILNQTGMLCGFEDTYVKLMEEDEALLTLVDRRLKCRLEVATRVLEKAKGLIDLFWTGDDLGTQRGPLISLDMFRRVLRPRHQAYIDLAKSHGLPVMMHSCGSSSWAYNDLIEMGVNVMDTLQPEAADMAPAYLKKTYGGRLAFHGCISTAGPLAYGTVDDVRRVVRETLEIMMPGGGYALAPTHQIQDNSPTENVLAMYETAWDAGVYK